MTADREHGYDHLVWLSDVERAWKAVAALAPSPAALEAWLDGREFYETMQAYRFSPLFGIDTVVAFAAVKQAILRALSPASAQSGDAS